MPTNPYPYRLKRRLQRFISPQPALPARLRRPRVLVVGCGAIGQRLLRHWQQQSGRSGQHGLRVLVLTSSPDKRAQFQALGATPIVGNLDVPASLQRLRGWAHYLLHLAPPPGRGVEDSRTQALIRALGRGQAARALVYLSTSGIYGDCGGDWVDETRRPAPNSARSAKRWHAEQSLRAYGLRGNGPRVTVLRVPGIYSAQRMESLISRLKQGQPMLCPKDDVWSNHIHAADLARSCNLALWRGFPQRSLNVCDDQPMRMGDYFDCVADALGLPRPPRIARSQAQDAIAPGMLAFLNESRRMSNQRLKAELRQQLQWPRVDAIAIRQG